MRAYLICTTDPVLEESLGLAMESASISGGCQQHIGGPELVHPVIPVLIADSHLLQVQHSSVKYDTQLHSQAVLHTAQ